MQMNFSHRISPPKMTHICFGFSPKFCLFQMFSFFFLEKFQTIGIEINPIKRADDEYGGNSSTLQESSELFYYANVQY